MDDAKLEEIPPSTCAVFLAFPYLLCVPLFVTTLSSRNNRVRAFSWKSPRPLAVLRSHEKTVHAVAYSPRIGGLVSGSTDSRVALWELFPDDKGRGGHDSSRGTSG